MEFKLGASLWGLPTAGRQSATVQQEATEDFGKRLGLPSAPQIESQPEQTATNSGWQLHTELGLKVLPQMSSGQDVGRHSVPSELYVWGSLAGHHLSHVADAFDGNGNVPVGFAISRAHPIADAVCQDGENVDGQSMPVVHADVVMGSGLSISAPAELNVRHASGAQSLAGFLAQRWPERRLLLLPRDQGVEIVVRDFHLSAEEQQVLSRDLQRFMPQATEPLEQIWINGQSVWKRAPLHPNSTQE